jgi:hypothetical protein
MRFTARISPQVRTEIERLSDESLSAAEITRRAGVMAERLGQRRPSYERVRMLVREVRRRPQPPPSTADVLLDIAFRVKPPDALLRVDPPRRRSY